MLASNQSLTLVAAMGRDRQIGYQGGMPWHLPRDLQHFKQVTLGHVVLMGRKTWDSLPFALPGRLNIVITRQTNWQADGALSVNSVEAAFHLAAQQNVKSELMVIGGAQLYEFCLPLANKMHLTQIDVAPQADTWFPAWRQEEWETLAEQHHPADSNNEYAVTFFEMQRTINI